MKTLLKVESITQTVRPDYYPPVRYCIRLVDEKDLVVHIVNATPAQMIAFAKIDAGGNPITRRDASVEPGDALTLLDNEPPALPDHPSGPEAPAPAVITSPAPVPTNAS